LGPGSAQQSVTSILSHALRCRAACRTKDSSNGRSLAGVYRCYAAWPSPIGGAASHEIQIPVVSPYQHGSRHSRRHPAGMARGLSERGPGIFIQEQPQTAGGATEHIEALGGRRRTHSANPRGIDSIGGALLRARAVGYRHSHALHHRDRHSPAIGLTPSQPRADTRDFARKIRADLLTWSIDQVHNSTMTIMPISEFKSKCIAVLKSSRQSGKPILVTWRGRPIARVEPIPDSEERRVLGIHRGRMKIRGDIVHFDASGEWEMLR